MKKITAVIVLIVMTAAMTVSSFAGTGITRKEAIDKALKDAGLTRSEVRALDAEKDGGKFEVEFISKADKTEFDYEISKKGTILEKSVEYRYKHDNSKEKIGREAARKKAADHSGVSYNKVKKGTCKYEYSNKKKEGKYEIKFRSGKYRYEYEILAPTGEVMEMEKKRK